jgi:hypothetical protein
MPPDACQRERPVVGREIGLFLLVEEELRWAFAARLAFLGLPGLNVRPVFRPVESIPRIEEENPDAPAGEVPGSHASGRSAADDDHRVDPSRRDDLHTPPDTSPKAPQADTEPRGQVAAVWPDHIYLRFVPVPVSFSTHSGFA